GPLVSVDRPRPSPGAHEVLVRVSACGVCRTDLHVAEGDLDVRRPNVVPGHEVVGYVEELGEDCKRFNVGDRVGIAWLRSTCGKCRFCERGDANLCVDPLFTGWDEDGGYAEFAVAPEAYTYSLKDGVDDVHAAPLLCAGIIGYRALKRAAVPERGVLGIYGFGGSAHIAMQVAIHQGARVHVMTRSEKAQRLAIELGAASASGALDRPTEPLDAAILFAPAGEVVPVALTALDRGGTLSIAGIHLTDVPSLDYRDHLFYERTVTSVTANTLEDGREFMELALRIPVQTSVQTYSLREADKVLIDLAHGRVGGAAVLVNDV
ncbi:MAG: zinc-dependent alcohol dehydrogenase family protein, partial [Actinomycetota bacterium]|nr:zinc-dependent alcohol dehydrogenase family protein [Actinomycetota bacterium]